MAVVDGQRVRLVTLDGNKLFHFLAVFSGIVNVLAVVFVTRHMDALTASVAAKMSAPNTASRGREVRQQDARVGCQLSTKSTGIIDLILFAPLTPLRIRRDVDDRLRMFASDGSVSAWQNGDPRLSKILHLNGNMYPTAPDTCVDFFCFRIDCNIAFQCDTNRFNNDWYSSLSKSPVA